MSGIIGSSHNIRGSGVVAKLGTDGQVFTSAGAGLKQTFEAAPGGDFVKLLSTSASASASIAIDGYFTTDYDRYMLFLGGCFFSAHNDSVFSLRYNYGGAALTGSNYVNMFESHQKVSGSISERQLSEWNNDKISLGYCSNAVTHPAVFQCTIWDPLNTTSYKLITTNGVGYGTTSGISVGGGCCAWIVDTNPISGITLYSENGADVTVSKIVLYGLKD